MDFLLLSLRTELAKFDLRSCLRSVVLQGFGSLIVNDDHGCCSSSFPFQLDNIARDIAAAAPFFPSAGADPFS